MRLRVQAIRSHTIRTLETSGQSGTVNIVQTEWGIGKGRLKREAQEFDLYLYRAGIGGVFTIKTRYWLIGARYRIRYQGFAGPARHIYGMVGK